MTLQILEEAEADIVEAARSYEAVSVDLASRFLAEVEKGLALIERYPQRFSAPPDYRGTIAVRRYLLTTFRYMIVYQMLPDSLLVICVTHCHRRPKHWKERTRR